MSNVLLLLLVLACPLMMWLMMRGGHGHGGGHAEHHDRHQGIGTMSVDELRDLRDDLDEVIAAREPPGDDGHARVTEK
jgi:hypothetical protein